MPPRRSNRVNNEADPAFTAAVAHAVADLLPTLTARITNEIRQNENNRNTGIQEMLDVEIRVVQGMHNPLISMCEVSALSICVRLCVSWTPIMLFVWTVWDVYHVLVPQVLKTIERSHSSFAY
nr:hypothetical protein [Tanacetum cinerariifolium]